MTGNRTEFLANLKNSGTLPYTFTWQEVMAEIRMGKYFSKWATLIIYKGDPLSYLDLNSREKLELDPEFPR